MVRSKLRRFGSLALIFVLLSALIVPTFIVSPAAITREEFEEYCKYGVFAGCYLRMEVHYINDVGESLSVTSLQSSPSLMYNGIYFNDTWSLLYPDVQQDYGEVTEVNIVITFAVPFTFGQALPTFMVNGFSSIVDIYPSFKTVDGDFITCYDISTSPEGQPQAVSPKFVFEEQSNQLIQSLSLSLSCNTSASSFNFNRLFTTEHFCIYTSGSQFTGYSAGYDEGYDDGYNKAWSESSNMSMQQYSEGYLKGKADGINSAQTAAREEGYKSGLNEGYNNGYLMGKQDGIASADINGSFASLFFSFWDAPVQALTGLLNFNFLGINMLTFFASCVTLVIFVFLIKKFFL